jgi:diaminohydroxyphosphoribosylaminopyrimidine deaminase/5-amino-6-(5-phosphoribosylamino)uracil reductase
MSDYDYLFRALKLAERGLGHTRPNPAVGAVIVKDGKIIGEGWHKRAGKDHAEVAAIKNALRRCGARALRGSTVYVTLEPCSKPGRVGACTDAIAAAGISKVVYAVPDPNPKNRGKAKRVLAKSGISCVLFKGDRGLIRACGRLIAGFRKHVLTALPFVTVKIAMSLDGRICDDWGDSDWISSAASRTLTNRMRSRVDAIMVGAQTVRKDNPSLLARVKPNKDLIRVVISRSGNLPEDAQIFTDGKNPTLVFDDAQKALRELGEMGITSVLCEGGLTLARSLAEAGLVDEWLTVLSPVHIGSRRISKAIRAATLAERCRFAHGDAFFAAGLSEFALSGGEGNRSGAVRHQED